MKFDIEYVEKLAKVLADNSLTEISLEDGEQAITLRKEITGVISAPAVPAQIPVQQAAPAEKPAEVKKGNPLTSPMVGTFYKAPSPDAKPYVSVGSTVKEGDTLCIIEAMKLMNEITAEQGGTITEICVKNGDIIEYGQTLFYIK